MRCIKCLRSHVLYGYDPHLAPIIDKKYLHVCTLQYVVRSSELNSRILITPPRFSPIEPLLLSAYPVSPCVVRRALNPCSCKLCRILPCRHSLPVQLNPCSCKAFVGFSTGNPVPSNWTFPHHPSWKPWLMQAYLSIDEYCWNLPHASFFIDEHY